MVGSANPHLDEDRPKIGTGPRGPGRIPYPLLIALAFLEGAAVMIVELTATRIMTPYFGQSVFVWTHIIGIVLAAVAFGNYLGGRWADNAQSMKPLFACLFLSGFFCIAIPHLIPGTASFFLGENLQLEEIFALLARASFATAMLLFAPPVFLAGVCLPFIVKAAIESCGKAGRGSGTIYGSSTLGSILGTFLTTYVLIPAMGSKMTFYATGMALVVLAGIGLAMTVKKGRFPFHVLIILVAAVAALGASPNRGFRSDENVVYEEESLYQYLSVVQKSEAPRILQLCLNEGLDSFHSIYVENDLFTGGQYYDYYCLLPALAGMERPSTVCLVGLAAGTSARQYAGLFGDDPRFRIDGVELDPMTVEVGKRIMDLGSAGDALFIYPDRDGRVFLAGAAIRYDVIIVDAYSKQVYIPFHMTTHEFFEILFQCLREGGIMGMNVNAFSFDDELLSCIANTAASVFDSVSVTRIPDGRNFMIYAVRGKGAVDPRDGLLPSNLSLANVRVLSELLDRITPYGITRKVLFNPDLPVLTDDRAPIELLLDHDLTRRSLGLVDQGEAWEK